MRVKLCHSPYRLLFQHIHISVAAEKAITSSWNDEKHIQHESILLTLNVISMSVHDNGESSYLEDCGEKHIYPYLVIINQFITVSSIRDTLQLTVKPERNNIQPAQWTRSKAHSRKKLNSIRCRRSKPSAERNTIQEDAEGVNKVNEESLAFARLTWNKKLPNLYTRW